MTKIIVGINDLNTVNPNLAMEWHPSKNINISPSMFTAGSHKKVWWLCKCGYEWEATIASRNAGAGCPVCAKKIGKEKLNKSLLKKSGTLIENNPSLAEEWHPTRNGNITPTDVTPNANVKVWWLGKCGHEWQASVKSRNSGNCGCPFCNSSKIIPGENDLASQCPDLLNEWCYQKNSNISPNNVSKGSNKKVWWICSKGHEWIASIKSRTSGEECPICSGHTIIAVTNDLSTRFPEIASEWHPTKNGSIDPSFIAPGSHLKVWWKCEKGHEWQASPNHRTSKGRGCPYCCHNPLVLTGKNDLATMFPAIAAEWHPSKNGELTPFDVTGMSSKVVWWKCPIGHEWKTSIQHRAGGSGCPKCAKGMQTSFPEQAIFYYVHKYYNDAVNGYTELFKNHGMELDIYIPSLQIGIEYDGVAYHRTDYQKQRDYKKYSICKNAGIRLIRIRESNEPCDSADYVIYEKGSLNEAIITLSKELSLLSDVNVKRDENIILEMYYSSLSSNSLSAKYPQIAKEWHPLKNGNLTPEMFPAHSNKKFWWICEKGHEWQASIDGRVRGNGCPFCSSNKVLIGYNDLKTLRPDLEQEWNYEKNKPLLPTQVTVGSGKKVWWRCCVCNNEWIAEINGRNKGSGCPVCSKKRNKL